MVEGFFFKPTFSGRVVRCGTHSDYGTLTFLFQDNAGGLEVQAVDKVLKTQTWPIPWTRLPSFSKMTPP